MTDDARDEVKRTLTDPIRVCSALGIDEGAKKQAGGLLIRCPSHGENNASCSVTVADGTIRVKCFACDLSGDVFNLVAAVESLSVDRDFPAVLARAAAIAGVDLERRAAPPRAVAKTKSAPPPVDREVQEKGATLWKSLQPLDGDGWEYLRSRGLDGAAHLCRTVTTGWLAKGGWVLAVAMHDKRGRVVAVQCRRITDEKRGDEEGDNRFRVEGPSSAGVFGDVSKLREAKAVVICEGLTDTLAATALFAGDVDTAVIGIAGVKATAPLAEMPLEGKTVAIAMDADAPGEAAAAEIAAKLAARGVAHFRPRIPRGNDLAGWTAAGGDFRGLVLEGLNFGFRSFADRLPGERAQRLQLAARVLSFGVKYLDDALGGIFPNDLILFGAQTGLGKTALSTLVATVTAAQNKRVHYLALEAEDREIERRIKYQVLSDMVHRDHRTRANAHRMNYMDWYRGKLEDLTGIHEAAVDVHLAEKYATLSTLYRVGSFTAQRLDETLKAIQAETDLVIVDHLHYVDTDDKDENRGYKTIVKTVRDAALDIGKPVILVAHLRKAKEARKGGPLVPRVDDFHGTSDIAKIATKAIMIAPAYDQPNTEPHLWNTYLSPVKCRVEGSRTRYVGLVAFNARLGRYNRAYEVGRLVKNDSEFKFLDGDDMPGWAADRPTGGNEMESAIAMLGEPPPRSDNDFEDRSDD